VLADSAYAGGEAKKLSAAVTCTTRQRKDVVRHGPPPQCTGRRGWSRHRAGPQPHRPRAPPGRHRRQILGVSP
jgi:hypothetical protein